MNLTPLLVAEILLFPGLTFFVFMAFILEWLERKTAARVQGRRGPVVAGPFGIVQPVADFFKLSMKEEIVPEESDKFIMRWGPPLYFAAPAAGLVFVPVIALSALIQNQFDLFFMFFILSFTTLMASLLGYASAGRYSTVAVGRLVLQYSSYEIPMLLSMIVPAVLSGKLSLSGIVAAQSGHWFVLFAPVGFAVFIIAALAELEKPPFDIPSASTEIVGGWMTEFSGNTLAYVKLTKNLSYVFLSALSATLFLGGPQGPIFVSGAMAAVVLHTFYFTVKLLFVAFLIFAIRTALARVKIDQATRLFWTILTPLALVQLGVAVILGW